MASEPEPCIGGRCFSPIACNGFGYCRERNIRLGAAALTKELGEKWREEAKVRALAAQQEEGR